jgi:universal stress protein E
MNKLVIVISDEEEGNSLALKKAKNIAAHFQAEVEVVRFLPQASSDSARRSASQSISELVHSVFNDLGGVTNQVVPTDSVPEWMADHCAPSEDNLVVKTGHRSESLFHTPTDWELIRQLHCPVLISSSQKWKSKPNVLIALDLSSDKAAHRELNALALRWARQWQAVYDCQLHAMYCILIPAPLLALDIVERHEYQRSHESEFMEQLVALLNEFGMSEVIPHILAGAPEKSISHMASELKADLVIMGSVGRGGVQRFLHRNTTENVLHHLRTDMLVVKPTEVTL